jgi:hypothetical protein
MSQLDLLLSWQIGTTPHEIAIYLFAKGITGKRYNVSQNPIARLINDYNPGLTWSHAEVGGGYVSFNDMQIMDYPLPKPVKDFLFLFNSGAFPELEETDTALRAYFAELEPVVASLSQGL